MALGTPKDVSGLTDAEALAAASAPVIIAQPPTKSVARIENGSITFYNSDANASPPNALRAIVTTNIGAADILVANVKLDKSHDDALRACLARIHLTAVGQ